MLRQLAGFGLMLLGIYLGIYLGVYVLFVGGLTQIINGVKANPTNAIDIFFGLVKFVSSGFIGWISFGVCFVFGIGLLDK